MMLANVFEMALRDAAVPAADAADYVLVGWLRERLSRPPSWLEVLSLRAGLRARARRRARWLALWRGRPKPPREEDLVADFLQSLEGRLLLQILGSVPALVAQLALPDPWAGFNGRHPYAQRPRRWEAVRERVALGYPIPSRDQAAAVLAYASWKLSGEPAFDRGFMPEAAEFLAPARAAAINAMTGTAVAGICARLRRARRSEPGRRAVLNELDRAGAEALRLWPNIGRRGPGMPLGILPPALDDPDDGDAGPAAVAESEDRSRTRSAC